LTDAGIRLWSEISVAQLEAKLGRRVATRRILKSLPGTAPAFLLRSRLDFEGQGGATAREVIEKGLAGRW
jgi:hypothetical protein